MLETFLRRRARASLFAGSIQPVSPFLETGRLNHPSLRPNRFEAPIRRPCP